MYHLIFNVRLCFVSIRNYPGTLCISASFRFRDQIQFGFRNYKDLEIAETESGKYTRTL